MTQHFDSVVVGMEAAGIIAGALLAKGGFAAVAGIATATTAATTARNAAKTLVNLTTITGFLGKGTPYPLIMQMPQTGRA